MFSTTLAVDFPTSDLSRAVFILLVRVGACYFNSLLLNQDAEILPDELRRQMRLVGRGLCRGRKKRKADVNHPCDSNPTSPCDRRG